jgi:hypothetical protein
MKLENEPEDRAAEERDRNRKLLQRKFSTIDCHMLPTLQHFPNPLILRELGPDREQVLYRDGILRLHALVAAQVAAPREIPSTDPQAEPALTGTRIAALMEKMAPAISNGGTFVMSNVEAMEAGAEVARLKAELAEKDAREQAMQRMMVKSELEREEREQERDAREKKLRAELEAIKNQEKKRLQTAGLAETPAPPGSPGAGSAGRSASGSSRSVRRAAVRTAEPAPGGPGGAGVSARPAVCK